MGCTGILKTKCPSDVPAGVTAAPQCALQDSGSGDKYCALLCSPSNIIKDQKAADAQCGTNASCKPIQTVGLCTSRVVSSASHLIYTLPAGLVPVCVLVRCALFRCTLLDLACRETCTACALLVAFWQ